MKRFFILFFILTAFFPLSTRADERAAVSARVGIIEKGKAFPVVFKLTVGKGYHVFWKTAGDTGKPTTLTFDLPDGFKVEKILYPFPTLFQTDGFASYGYDGETFITAIVKGPENEPAEKKPFAATLDFAVCGDVCRPETKKISGVFASDADGQKLFEKVVSAVPGKADASFVGREKRVSLTVLAPEKTAFARFFPDGDVIAHAAPQPLTLKDGTAVLTLTPAASFDGKKLSGTVVFYDAARRFLSAADVAAPPSPPPVSLSFLAAVCCAFFGGVLVNLMPCMFPALSLRAYAALRGKKENLRRDALCYWAGLLCAFFAAGGAVTCFKTAQTGNGWGFQMQSPTFVFLTAWLMFAGGSVLAFGGGLSGLSSFSSRFSGAVGAFLTGLFAVLTATPCVAPFAGVALAYAAVVPASAGFCVLAVMATGMAAPFLITGFWSKAASFLPGNGSWTEAMRDVSALAFFGAGCFFMWVLTVQKGESALGWTLCVLFLTACAVWAARIGKKTAVFAGLLCVAAVVAAAARLSATETERPLAWRPYRQAETERLRAENVPVFVKFSASWCLTCLINEKTTLRSSAVTEAFRDKGVALFAGDLTEKNDAVEAALESFGRTGVPLYVYFPPDNGETKILPQLLTPSAVTALLKGL